MGPAASDVSGFVYVYVFICICICFYVRPAGDTKASCARQSKLERQTMPKIPKVLKNYEQDVAKVRNDTSSSVAEDETHDALDSISIKLLRHWMPNSNTKKGEINLHETNSTRKKFDRRV